MGESRLKAFRFENLERLSRRDVELRAAILRYLPAALPPEIFVPAITQQLEKYTGDKVLLELTALREPKFKKYRSSVPDPAILFILSCVPLEKKAILQVDTSLAHILVDRVLGGVGEFPQDLRSVTPIEEGVLQFLVLKILTLLAQAVAGAEVQFRLDRMLTEPQQLDSLGEDDELMALLSVQVTVGKKAGFVRLALPHPLVEGLLKALTPADQRFTKKDLSRLERISDMKMPIWIELGHVEVSNVDVARLEVGDVILFDQVNVEIGEEGIQGPVVLRVKEGVGGGFHGHIRESKPDKIAVQVDSIF